MSDIVHEIQEKLWLAAEQGDCAAIRALVLKGADMDARDDIGRTALNIATQYSHAEAVTTLLSAKKLKFMIGLGLSPEEILQEETAKKKSGSKTREKRA